MSEYRSPFSDRLREYQRRLSGSLIRTCSETKAQRLGDVWRANVVIEIEVGNRSRDSERPVVAACRDRPSLRRFEKKAVAVAG